MPELPEVEILARHLRPLLHGRTIRAVEVLRPKVLAPTPVPRFKAVLRGATFLDLTRRGKYLLFTLRALPKHTAVVLDLGRNRFVYEDPRYFGRLTLDVRPVARLGPEPMAEAFTSELLAGALKRSRQAIKVKLLDQSLVAGIGNIYASESLFRAGLSPRRPANRLSRAQVEKLWQAIREVLTTAIECGSTIPLNFETHPSDRLFYYGSAAGAADFYTERLVIYDRAGQPCGSCGTLIKRIVQAARSTFFCPHCQKS